MFYLLQDGCTHNSFTYSPDGGGGDRNNRAWGMSFHSSTTRGLGSFRNLGTAGKEPSSAGMIFKLVPNSSFSLSCISLYPNRWARSVFYGTRLSPYVSFVVSCRNHSSERWAHLKERKEMVPKFSPSMTKAVYTLKLHVDISEGHT